MSESNDNKEENMITDEVKNQPETKDKNTENFEGKKLILYFTFYLHALEVCL